MERQDVPSVSWDASSFRAWVDAVSSGESLVVLGSRITPPAQQACNDGFCDEGLWPLCHRTSVRPTFRDLDFQMYSLANARWVAALCGSVTTESPVVLVQGYHLALAPMLIRARLPLARIATFWRIPFPTPKALSSCPWEREVIESLLGSSVLGFQTAEDCQNFLDAAVCVLGAHVDDDTKTVSYGGHRTLARTYPASVEWPDRWVLQSASVNSCRTIVRRRFQIPQGAQLVLGIDRLDYTKGLPHKFLALERLLVTRPDFRGKVVLLQIVEPRRPALSAYSEHRTCVHQMADRINERFGRSGYEPIVLIERHLDRSEVCELMRASDVCYVGSLHDGMNLVSKEFVSARDDESGVLILSEFAGAARELTDALCINPYASDDCARTLAEALTMPIEEQARRMQCLRRVLQRFHAYQWNADLLRDATATMILRNTDDARCVDPHTCGEPRRLTG